MTRAELAAEALWGSRLQFSVTSAPIGLVDDKPADYVAAFHQWIRKRSLDELLIDVASYEHVPSGPGVLLVGHECDYSVRFESARRRLTCRHKRNPSSKGDAVQRSVERLIKAVTLLEQDNSLPGQPRFNRTELLFESNDRLIHPNDAATVERVSSALKQCLPALLGQSVVSVHSDSTPRERVALRITLSAPR